jgi:predicted CopG family antitoxin
MGTKTVRLREDVYERIRSRKRDDETFSEAIDRLTGDASLGDLAGTLTDEEAAAAEAAAEASAEADRRESDELHDEA